MPEVKGKVKTKLSFVTELVKLWPSLPYLGFGVWLAWASLVYSGTLWLSANEENGKSLSYLYMVSTAVFALICLGAPIVTHRMKSLLASKPLVVGSGILCGIGCLMVVLAGPFYLGMFCDTGLIFWGGAVLSGIGTSIIGLKCGELFGDLPPRRVLLYASLSQIMIAFIYFAVVGSPLWAPVANGPSLAGILSFTLLPAVAALLICLPKQGPNAEAEQVEYDECPKNLPVAFWRLVALSFLLPIVASMMRAVVVSNHTLAVTLEGNNILMLLRVLMAVAFIVVALGVDASHMNFGKLYSLIAIFMVVAIACIPVFGVLNSEWSLLIYFASSIFEFVMWCLLAFVVFQKRISPIIVFGFGRGMFMLGSAIGWALGVFLLPGIDQSPTAFAFYMVCAGVVLVLSFVLFSERDYERLFSPINESELSLEGLMDVGLREEKKTDKKGRFSEAITHLAEANKLSARETDVFRLLAMGRGSEYVAEKLQVSWNTARTHTHNVYVKLDVHSRQELIDLVDQGIDEIG